MSAKPERRHWLSQLTRFWDWVDERQIDKHAVSLVILAGTWRLTNWAIDYVAANPIHSGADIALVVAAVTGPYMVLQAAAIGFYFSSRSNGK